MEADKKLDENEPDLFQRYGEEINRAYERAVRDALRKHKLAGNPVAIGQNGNVVLLQPDEIDIEDE